MGRYHHNYPDVPYIQKDITGITSTFPVFTLFLVQMTLNAIERMCGFSVRPVSHTHDKE